MRCNSAPTSQCARSAPRSATSSPVAQVAGFSVLVDHRIEFDDGAEVASLGLRVRHGLPRLASMRVNPPDVAPIGPWRCQPPGAAGRLARRCQHANDADANLAGTGDRQHEDLELAASPGVPAPTIAAVWPQGRREMRVSQHRCDERAETAPQGKQCKKKQSPAEAGCDDHGRYGADAVPIIGTSAQRSPELRRHTTAAEVPAQNGSSAAARAPRTARGRGSPEPNTEE